MKLNWTLGKFLNKDPTFQYVSILRTIEVVLLKKGVQKYAVSSGEIENDGLICVFKDGLIFKKNPLWTSSNKTKQIMLYCDEFVCANRKSCYQGKSVLCWVH